MTARTYTLLGPDRQPYQSTTPGALGGYRPARIYGRLDCPSALRAIARGQYVRNRVFFADEQTAVAAGYRPCAVCLPDADAQWRAAGLSEVGAAGDFTQELPREVAPNETQRGPKAMGVASSRRPFKRGRPTLTRKGSCAQSARSVLIG
jgi:Metal binding domain of Ada